MNKKIRTLALLPILSVILTACTIQDLPLIGQYFGGSSAGGGVTNEPVTLNIWGLWESPEVMNSIIAKYQEQHPNVTINYEDRSIMSLAEYKERIFTRFQDPQGNIDIALVHNSWVSRMSTIVAPAPEGTISVSDYESKYFPVITESGVVNNQVLAVPFYYDNLVLVYNRDHFEEINQSLAPTAWEEFRRLALALTVRGEDGTLVRGGAAMGAANNVDHFSDIIGLMWAQAGVGITPEIESQKHYSTLAQYNALLADLDTSPAADALAFYTNFLKEDQVWAPGMPEATEAFINGQASMIFVPSWRVLDIIGNMPDANSVGVAPVPQAIPDDPRSWGTFWMYSVSSNSPNASVAWDFLNFMSQEEQQLSYFNDVSRVRFFGNVYPSVSLASEISNPVLVPVVQSAPFATSNEMAARSGNITQVEALRTAVNDVISNRSTPSDALKDMKSTLSGN